jgi:hypothetical protein
MGLARECQHAAKLPSTGLFLGNVDPLDIGMPFVDRVKTADDLPNLVGTRAEFDRLNYAPILVTVL